MVGNQHGRGSQSFTSKAIHLDQGMRRSISSGAFCRPLNTSCAVSPRARASRVRPGGDPHGEALGEGVHARCGFAEDGEGECHHEIDHHEWRGHLHREEENTAGALHEDFPGRAVEPDDAGRHQRKRSCECREHRVMRAGDQEKQRAEKRETDADRGGAVLRDRIDLGAHDETHFRRDDLPGHFQREEDEPHTEAHEQAYDQLMRERKDEPDDLPRNGGGTDSCN